jgi:DNA invertase Pin-like site-specific DNA recombinase
MIAKQKRVALYLRVSTVENQTVENQRRELEAVAARHGWQIVATFSDEGVSGAKGRDKRPGFDMLLKGVAKREYDLIASWSVDRLGRSLQALMDFLGEIHAKRIDLYLHQQGLDTTTPMGKAMFQVMGVFAEFERAMIISRVKSGLERVKADPRSEDRKQRFKEGKIKQFTLGRPSAMTPAKELKARALLAQGVGVNKIGKQLRVGTGTIQKIKAHWKVQQAA